MRERYFILAETAHRAPHDDSVKVTLLHYSAPPVIGGVERILEKHAQLLSADGHEVTVICGDGIALESPSGTPPIRFLHIPALATSHPQVRIAQAELASGRTAGDYAAFRDCLIQELLPLFNQHDVVILHNVCTMPFHLALTEALWQLATELPQIRFICWIHDVAAVNPDYLVPFSHPWDLLRRPHEAFEYVAVSSLRQKQWIKLTGIPPERCTVIPNGLDPVRELGLSPNVAQLTETLDLLDADLILLQPTRLLVRKNVELSLHVIAELKARGLRTYLLITGAPDPHNAVSAGYANQLLSLCDELHLRNDCLFLGERFDVTENDVRSLYQIADALFFPSRQEGFGLPMLEAALHRVPAFCSDIEPLRDLPGAIPFSLDTTPLEITSLIIRQMRGWPANSPRKAVARNYVWSVIYRNFLAPLLKRHKESLHP